MHMALRSQEEMSLATVFARTLGNVIALTTAEEKRAWPTPAQVLEHTPDDAAGAAAPSGECSSTRAAGGQARFSSAVVSAITLPRVRANTVARDISSWERSAMCILSPARPRAGGPSRLSARPGSPPGGCARIL